MTNKISSVNREQARNFSSLSLQTVIINYAAQVSTPPESQMSSMLKCWILNVKQEKNVDCEVSLGHCL